MRVILVVVLCLSSGFWTNGSEQDNSTERSSTNGDLKLDSTTLKSITDKGTTVGTANALQNGKTELLSRHLSDLISALKSSTPRVLVGNPAKSTTQPMLGAKSTATSRSTQIESSTSSTNADKSTENPKLSTLDLPPTTHIMTSTSTPIVGNVNSATQTALGATFTPGSTTPQIQSSRLGAMPGNVAESTNKTILGALSMPDSSTTQIQRPKLRMELPIGSNVATQSTTQTTSGATFTPGSSTTKVQSSSDGASVGETTESPKPTTLDPSTIAGGGDYAENTAPIMSAALSMPDSNKSSKLMSEESPEPTTLDPSTIVGDPAESTAPIMSAALSMPDSNQSSKLMSEESPKLTTIDPSRTIQIKKSNYGPIGDHTESTTPTMPAALSMPDSDSNKNSGLMPRNVEESTTQNIAGTENTSDSPITNEMNTDLTTTYMAEELTTKYSTTNKKEETSSTGPSQSPTPTPEPMTTTIACSNPYAPVLYFDNYEIIWNIKPKQDCDIDSVNLTCVTKDDEYSRTFDSTVNSLNVLDEKITQGKVYSCEAFLNATNGATSEKSNTLQLPPGTQHISPNLSNLTLKWDRPFENASLTYSVDITGTTKHTIPDDCDQKDTRSVTTNMPNITLKADFSYIITIYTSFWKLYVTNITQIDTPSTAPGPPRDVKVSKNTTGYILSGNMPCDPNGVLLGYNIELSELADSFLKTKTTESISEIDIFDFFNTQPKPSTTYSVSVSAIGLNNVKGEAATFEFVTDALPNTPNLTITFQNATSFGVGWDMDTSNITKYELNIDILGPTYPQNPHCQQPSPISAETLLKNQSEYSFNEAWPSYKYKVSLTAYSVSGQGPTGYINVTTSYSEPEAPTGLTIIPKSLENNLIPVNISWMDPCKINGNMNGYWIEIKERYTEEEDQQVFYNGSVTDQIVYRSFNPSHEYFIRVAIQLDDKTIGSWVENTIATEVGYPGPPILNPSKITKGPRDLYITWERPIEKTGPIELYDLGVKYLEPMYEIPQVCSKPTPVNFSFLPSKMNQDVTDLLPYSKYEIKIRASTIPGLYGNYTTVTVTTLESDPDKATNIITNCTSELTEAYTASLNVYFNTPCNLYGPFQNFTIKCHGKRNGYNDVNLIGGVKNAIYDRSNWFSTMDLVPQYDYSCNITTFNNLSQSISDEFMFKSPAGEPNFTISFNGLPVLNVEPNNAQIHLKKIYFESWQADAQYIALILTKNKVVNYTSYRRMQSDWPALDDQSRQITPDFWYPFNDKDEFYFTVGNGSALNPALEPDQSYHLSVRVITDTFYTDSPTLDFTTASLSKAGLIVGIIISLLLIALLGVAGFFVWKRGLHRKFIEKYIRPSLGAKPPPLSATAIPVKKFVHYFNANKNKPEVFKQEFIDITEQGKEIQSLHTSNFAGLLENRRKNRYVNILPFDATRVKLLIDEDDEIGSDYINASYVKGYSGDIEYIATQGPLATTCRDFWKLVLQENVTIIVMVANFVEKNKVKCHKYFPENHENLIVGDNMEIRCATELHFGTHVIRNLQIRKDLTQYTVTHMQFLEWPDFRVPTGTEHMLQFCHKLRERVRLEGGIMIVHCSAGVGRTGTLIAADILLQTAAARKPLDVYKTVLDLRKQRCMMVQTEEQYIYVHRLLADHIDRPATPDATEADPVYENMDMIKRRTSTSDYRSTTDEEESGL